MLPSDSEKRFVESVKNKVAKRIKDCLPDVDYRLQFVGSTATGTFVSGEYDIDAFVVTKDNVRAFDKISRCIKGSVKEGELDIWHTKEEGVETDIVVVDPDNPKTQTLEHEDHYNRILTDRHREEIIKGKLLMKGFGCYSAELGGITGIAITELVSKYGNLAKSCKALGKGKFFLEDPTIANRDLLASVNKTRWNCIKKACRSYRETGKVPAERFTEESFKAEREAQGFKVVSFPRRMDTAIDFMRSLSACETCANELRNLERDLPKPECDAFVGEKVWVAYKTESQLSATIQRKMGKRRRGSREFRMAHPDARVVGNWLVVDVKRKVTRPQDWLVECVGKKYLQHV